MPNISENSSQLSAIARIFPMDSKDIIHVLYSKDITVLIDNKDIIHELQRYCSWIAKILLIDSKDIITHLQQGYLYSRDGKQRF
jgi:hypothetical protein